ncbi:MAG: GNAT family N-acetyltransferase [Caldimonas sp.]
MPGAAPHRPTVRRLEQVPESDVAALAALLIDCVDGGASVSFMQPLDVGRAETFWRGVAAGVAAGDRALFVADDGEGIVGTVQLVLGQPENQPHRADVSKMLVHRRARRQGIGAALMRSAEEGARAAGRTLLVLDTASADAERLYARLGWQRCGTIPGYALLPQGGPCDTTFFYRVLVPAPARATPGTPRESF